MESCLENLREALVELLKTGFPAFAPTPKGEKNKLSGVFRSPLNIICHHAQPLDKHCVKVQSIGRLLQSHKYGAKRLALPVDRLIGVWVDRVGRGFAWGAAVLLR